MAHDLYLPALKLNMCHRHVTNSMIESCGCGSDSNANNANNAIDYPKSVQVSRTTNTDGEHVV
jgi:hypothetical protein